MYLREIAKQSKEVHYGYLHMYKYENPRRNKKEIKVLSTPMHKILIYVNCRKNAMQAQKFLGCC